MLGRFDRRAFEHNMKQNSPERQEISREPWREGPVKEGQKDADAKWGWLKVFDDHTFEFDMSNRPTDKEIKNRKGCWTAGHGL